MRFSMTKVMILHIEKAEQEDQRKNSGSNTKI